MTTFPIYLATRRVFNDRTGKQDISLKLARHFATLKLAQADVLADAKGLGATGNQMVYISTGFETGTSPSAAELTNAKTGQHIKWSIETIHVLTNKA